jgi:integration host factor subunit alpha
LELPRTLTKANIVQSIAEYNGYSKDESKDIVATLLEIMKRTLESGEDVMISGFGKFCIQDKKKRRGRNPATGDEMILNARRVVTFKCSAKLRERVNG